MTAQRSVSISFLFSSSALPIAGVLVTKLTAVESGINRIISVAILSACVDSA